jgi:hypothetical protein
MHARMTQLAASVLTDDTFAGPVVSLLPNLRCIHQSLSRPATANHTCEWTRVCASLLDRSLHQIKACRAQCYLSSPWTSCATLSPHVRTLELNAPTKSMAESYSHTTTTDRLVRPSSCLRSPTPSMRPTTRRLLRRDHVKRADEHWPQGPTRASLSRRREGEE